jgi:hypothetical protein
VLYIATGEDLQGVTIGTGNVLRKLEAEVGIQISPTEFANRASIIISAAQARGILRKMGINLPSRIDGPSDISYALNTTPRMNAAQIARFVELVRQAP